MAMPDGFIDDLRHALNHLYEPDVLRYSPLRRLLPDTKRARSPMALAQLLTETIESLRPNPSAPLDTRAQRVHELLYYRYVQCCTQADLARQLSCSTRQVRREQSKALAILAEHLFNQAGLSQGDPAALGSPDHDQSQQAADTALEEEFEWLLRSSPDDHVDLSAELIALRDVVDPLLRQHGVRLELLAGSDPLVTTIPGPALRQALLSLLASLVTCTPGGSITITCQLSDAQVHVSITAKPAALDGDPAEVDDSLGDAMGLLRLSGGTLTLAHDDVSLEVDVYLPRVDMVKVLAVDDNIDVLELMRRYTEGTRYHLVPCDDPNIVAQLIDAERPQLIVLDVMMSGVDGWSLLQLIRGNPHSADVPIIVCSVLAQEKLAESLGANDFLRKPVTRETFVAALSRQSAKLASGPRRARTQHSPTHGR